MGSHPPPAAGCDLSPPLRRGLLLSLHSGVTRYTPAARIATPRESLSSTSSAGTSPPARTGPTPPPPPTRCWPKRGRELVQALGYTVEALASGASMLTADGHSHAVAVFCAETDTFESPSSHFNGSSPVAHAFTLADKPLQPEPPPRSPNRGICWQTRPDLNPLAGRKVRGGGGRWHRYRRHPLPPQGTARRRHAGENESTSGSIWSYYPQTRWL